MKRLITATLFFSLIANHVFTQDISFEIVQLQFNYNDLHLLGSHDSILNAYVRDQIIQIIDDQNRLGYYFLGSFRVESGKNEKAARMAVRQYSKFCRSKEYKYFRNKLLERGCISNEMMDNRKQKPVLAAVTRPGEDFAEKSERRYLGRYEGINYEEQRWEVNSYVKRVPFIMVFLFSYFPDIANYQIGLPSYCKSSLHDAIFTARTWFKYKM